LCSGRQNKTFVAFRRDLNILVSYIRQGSILNSEPILKIDFTLLEKFFIVPSIKDFPFNHFAFIQRLPHGKSSQNGPIPLLTGRVVLLGVLLSNLD